MPRPEDAAHDWLTHGTRTQRMTIPVDEGTRFARRTPHGGHYVTLVKRRTDDGLDVVVEERTGELLAPAATAS